MCVCVCGCAWITFSSQKDELTGKNAGIFGAVLERKPFVARVQVHNSLLFVEIYCLWSSLMLLMLMFVLMLFFFYFAGNIRSI